MKNKDITGKGYNMWRQIMRKIRILVTLILVVYLFIACSGNAPWKEESDGKNYSGQEVSENITAYQLSENMIVDPSDIKLVDQAEEKDIICDNPYFFSSDVSYLKADISFFDSDTEGIATIRGELELHWLKQYKNGCIAKLSLLPFDNMPEYLLNGSIWAEGEYEYCDIYFYVTSDEIYRINSCVTQDGEYVYAYDDEDLFLNILDSDEKIIENAELVCCPEGIESEYTSDNIGDDCITGEIGTHYEIVVSENQITYCRQEYPAGHMEFYNTFVWENGRGLVEHKRGYRAGALILYIGNITVV